jgi:FAD synthetase
MSKVITLKKAIKISKNLHSKKKTLVLSGGCFDILHLGHIKFLKGAKRQGNSLFVLLESDESVKALKGKERPINSAGDRAEILSSLHSVDYIIALEGIKENEWYDKLILELKPDVIAITKGNQQIKNYKRKAKLVNAKVIEVIGRIENKSSTNLAKLIAQNF